MGFKIDDTYEPNSTPKLSLSKLPYCKPREPPRHMQTPPLRSSVSIPFHWEEVPGKPKAAAEVGAPPSAATATTPPSSKNRVVRKGPASGREEGLRPPKRRGTRNFGSGRWGSFKGDGKFGGDNSDFSRSLCDNFKSDDNVKVTRVRRRRSFFSLSTINSKYLWADIYASFKQAVPWRHGP